MTIWNLQAATISRTQKKERTGFIWKTEEK